MLILTKFLVYCQAREDNYERTLQDEAKELEQLLNKRNILLARQDDYMKKIRDLGSLPSDAFEAYVLLHWIDLNSPSQFFLLVCLCW